MSDHNEKLSLLSQLVKLARADEDLKESEFQFLTTIANQLGVSQVEFREIFDKNIAHTPPTLEFDRIVQFHRLVLLMNIDQQISDKEIQMIQSMGIRMGLHPLAIAEILDTMKNYPNHLIPPDKLISIFATFHN